MSSLLVNISGATSVVDSDLMYLAQTSGTTDAKASRAQFLTGGSSNVALGSSAGSAVTTGTNNTNIGNNAQPGSSGAVNRVVLGNGATGTVDDQVMIGGSGTTTYTPFRRNLSEAAVTASGVTQATAIALVKEVNVVASAASGLGVILPIAPAVGSMPITVINNAAVFSIAVYPQSGAAIGANGTNGAQVVLSGTIAQFFSTSVTQWYAK